MPIREIELLATEGVKIVGGKVQDFEERLFKDFKTTAPLRRLKREQELMAREVSLVDGALKPKIVGAADVAYKGDTGWGALVLWAVSEGEVQKTIEVRGKAEFPYIPTYLSYREMPIIDKLLAKCPKLPDILLLDGNGVMHPRGLGLASHVGVANSLPTIGVAKSPLFTNVPDEGWFTTPQGARCYALMVGSKSYYVSAGHRVTPQGAVNLVKRLTPGGYPEPLRLAHASANFLSRGGG